MTTATAPLTSIDALTRAEADLGRSGARLCFGPALERKYEISTAAQRTRLLRFWLLFGLTLRIIGVASEVAIGGDVLTYGLVLRFGVILPVVLVSLVLLSPRFPRIVQAFAATTAPFLCVVGLAVIGTVAAPPNEAKYFYLAGVNIIAINIVMPLRFQHALAFTFASVAAYVFVALSGWGGLEFRTVSDIVFMFSFAGIASLAVTYRNDLADRRAFLAKEKIRLQAAALEAANEELKRLLTTDALTGVYNRRHLDESLKAHGERAAADKTHLGVVMVDVDHFKAYNDLLGHRAGDQCLREVARVIEANIRVGTDIVTRYGGEEFAVLAPGLSEEGTEALAERIRAAIEARAIPHPRMRDAKVTVSAGTSAMIPQGVGVLESLFEAADGALYRSKNLGRNRVTSANAPAADGLSEGKSAA